MEPSPPRRYLDGFSAGVQARERRVRPPAPPWPSPVDAGPSSTDPWRALLACAENDRPPAAGERAALIALGVVDLAPEGRDGCRLRMRGTPGGRLRAWQLRELAAVSQESAGGFIEIGERGGQELAVVGWREAAGALARLRSVGLTGGNGDGVRCSLTAGLDPGEIFDVMDLAMTLDAALSADGLRVGLDGGARGWGDSDKDDLTLRAGTGDNFLGTAGGQRFGVPVMRAASAVVALAEIFRGNGRRWEGLETDKMREALERALDGSLPTAPEILPATPDRGLPPGTTFPQKQPGLCALVAAGPADGLWRSRALVALAGLAEELGAGEARLWPGGVLVPGVAEGRGEEGRGRLAEIVSLVR